MSHKVIGERIKTIRQIRKLTREEVAEKSGISSKFLYEIENGKKGLSADNLLQISKTLSCSCDYIMTGEKFEEKQYEKAMQMLAEFDDEDVVYVMKILTMLKDMREKSSISKQYFQ